MESSDKSSTEKETAEKQFPEKEFPEKGLPEKDFSKKDFSEKDFAEKMDSPEQPRQSTFLSRLFPHHRLRVSIRTQLIALVLFVALFSLLTLVISTGVYFSTVLEHTRASKLEVEAQLKAAQMQQGFNYYYYQVSLLSSKDSIQSAMAYRKAGNTSSAVIEEAESTIQQFLDTTTLFNGARLYDPSFKSVANVSGTLPNDTQAAIEDIYVLGHVTVDSPPDGLMENGGFIWGPIEQDGDYFASLTIPINTNTTFLLEERALGGYLTMILNVTMLEYASFNTSFSDAESARFFRPDFPIDNSSDITGFSFVFQPDPTISIEKVYPLDSYKPIQDVLAGDSTLGHVLGVKNPLGNRVSVGYAKVDLNYGTWAVTLEQDQSSFMQPVSQLTRIMVGVVIGISALMCFITFVLAHYGVRPILRLQKATEAITEGRGLRSRRKHSRHRHGFHFHDKKRSNGGQSYDPNVLVVPASRTVTSNELRADERRPTSFTGNSQLSHRTSYSASASAIPSNSVSHAGGGSIASNNELRSRQGSEGFLESTPTTEVSTDAENSRTTPLPAIVPTSGLFYDELTELTEAFNSMTEELDRQYAHLEDRVRARTRELEAAKVQADTARQQAEAANEAKTVFIANISHELRTPLNGILGMTSIAMAEKDTKKIQSSLELIFRSGELLLHILTQLLTFSKNQLDKSKLQKNNFMLIEVASQIHSIFNKTAKDQKVDLSILIKPDLSRRMIMLGDSNRIIQVVMNLVSNSLKFTPENGTVKVVLKLLGEYDKERSAAANYEQVYVKGLADGPRNSPSHHPNTARARASSTLSSSSSLSLASSSEYSIKTLTSSVYSSALADSYNFGHCDREYFDEEEDAFIGPTVPDSSLVRRFHESYRFGGLSKYWVVRLSVSDTGTGIDESLQEKIFDAFVQGDQTLSRSHGGTGLGLSICKQFARLMHGTLTLKSKVGEGSKFTFTIPLPQVGELIVGPDEATRFYDDQFNPLHPPTKKVSFAEQDGVDKVSAIPSYLEGSFVKPELITRASTGTARSRMSDERSDSISSDGSPDEHMKRSHLRFLVAEDNLVNQEVVKRMMKLEGYTDVTLACDGYEAIDLVKSAGESDRPFDLVLMDVQMPKMDGITATKILRKDMGYGGPIVALTAFADKSNEDDCTKVGMSGFLSKPVRRNLLRDIIEKFCADKDGVDP
ncbi:DEKNAAC101188 [Brettanomyces naardenensis]|uniref:histidine kinase n=1 Tax=Brettanomyces naardenensis TaxID=13370 RepID=A0A448YH47_BRENA|nr:DEKNAAC101188 [Brettanomyces naardenensis]